MDEGQTQKGKKACVGVHFCSGCGSRRCDSRASAGTAAHTLNSRAAVGGNSFVH